MSDIFDDIRKSQNARELAEETLLEWKARLGYQEIVTLLEDSGGPFYPIRYRDWLVTHYAWAIPNAEAIGFLTYHSVFHAPLYEIGAGNGYWAYCIDKAGGNIDAWDSGEWCQNPMHLGIRVPRDTWYPVRQCHASGFTAPADKTLMLCWPTYDEPWATDVLTTYSGKNLIYIGEGSGGCCGDDELHAQLRYNWTETRVITIPQYTGINDALFHYERKE